MIEKIKTLLGKPKEQHKQELEGDRPVKFVEEGPNVWRVVWVEDQSQYNANR